VKNTFGKNIIPDNEHQRLNALKYYDVLKNLPVNYFDAQAEIIAIAFNTPIALISIVADDKVYFKGNVGMPGVTKVDRGVSLCSLAILSKEPTIFTDALQEPCLLTNPLVAGDFGLRFYAGAPITTPDGLHLGAVCIVDVEPRDFTNDEQKMLVHFAESVMSELEVRKKQQDALKELSKTYN
jgi:GAF domain-containing protein